MILYIEDYFSKIQEFLVKRKLVTTDNLLIPKTNFVIQVLNSLNLAYFEADGLELHYFLKEILNFNNYRYLLCKKYSKCKNLYIKVIPPKKEPLDYLG